MESMILSFHVGMVCVQVNQFQQHCLKYPQTILNELEIELPRQASAKCDQLTDEIKVANMCMYIPYLCHSA